MRLAATMTQVEPPTKTSTQPTMISTAIITGCITTQIVTVTTGWLVTIITIATIDNTKVTMTMSTTLTRRATTSRTTTRTKSQSSLHRTGTVITTPG